MAELPLTDIIDVSVSQAGAGVGRYNTSNLALFTDDPYDVSGFGSLGYKIYNSPSDVATDFGSSSNTYKMALAVFSQRPNILAGGGYLVVIPLNSQTLAAAITASVDLVQYFGVMCTLVLGQVDGLAAAAVIQAVNKMLFLVGRLSADINPGGFLDLIRSGGFTQTRGLYYGADTDLESLIMMASYAGRALSTNFTGSNTTLNMNLKDLAGVDADPSVDETVKTLAEAAGADIYASFQGVAKVLCSGANRFFDQVYNQLAFVGDLQVAGFNFLAQSSTKVPQTENGMSAFKSAYRKVCEQYVTNRYIAPGEWTSGDTFGNLDDFLANIEQRGYYIYSQPVSQQLQADREDRIAPTVQIAIKEAGAINKGFVLVNINA